MTSTSGVTGDKPINLNSKFQINLQKSKNHSEWKVVQKKIIINRQITLLQHRFRRIFNTSLMRTLNYNYLQVHNFSLTILILNMTHDNNGNDNIITNLLADRYSVE